MSGSTIGKLFRVTTWGESFGPAIGAVIDGCPAGLSVNEEMIQHLLDMRRPGGSFFSSQRKETDRVEILSGVFKGKTCGGPISLLIRSVDQRLADYSELSGIFRPGHADYTYFKKYGIRDVRGGGRSSGRETAARVAAGAVAELFLNEIGVELLSYTRSIGPVAIKEELFSQDEITKNPFYMPDEEAAKRAANYVKELKGRGDSCGGIIECKVANLPAGLGEPVFDKLDADLSKALMSVGAVKAVEIGDGMAATFHTGSQNNDEFAQRNGRILKLSNHAGGVLGGISDGSCLIARAAVKPTPSISLPQRTVKESGEETLVRIKGRHDTVLVPRAVPVIEAMTALTLADHLLENMTSRLDKIKSFYSDKNVEIKRNEDPPSG